MKKPAITNYPIHEILSNRWSPRSFLEKPVEPENVNRLLEAFRWAPSCFNAQPWRLLVATRENEEAYTKLLNCLVEGNIVWARKAPVLMITVAQLHFSHNNKPNRHAYHDVGLAVVSMTFQAESMGLVVHQMGGILSDRIREEYAIPEGYDPLTGIAIGYQGEPDSLPEKYREMEKSLRTRKELSEFVYTGNWGENEF